ncbi:MAG: hypothetical protein JNL62_02860 [Bryobacterales bacterium]|nr:hypothetical protein [Bryobacterales bacterium]
MDSAKRITKKERLRLALAALLDRDNPPIISESIAQRLRQELPAMSDRLFRDLLRTCGLPLAPLVEGVRQDDFHDLERTLLLLAQEYQLGDTARRKTVRAAVIEAKNHARLAAANPKVAPVKRAEKDEMVLWLLTWLENPSIFELWVPLRKARLATEAQSLPPR